MEMENRIKGISSISLALLFFVLYLLETFLNDGPFSFWVVYLFFDLVLFGYGLYLIFSGRLLTIWEDILITFSGLVLAILLIIDTKGIYSMYFPFIYLVALTYPAFTKGKKFFFISTSVGLIIIFSWVAVSTNISYFFNLDLIIPLVVYIGLIMVIRNYRFECFWCDVEENSCKYRDSCVVYRTKWNNHFGEAKIIRQIRKVDRVNSIMIAIYFLTVLFNVLSLPRVDFIVILIDLFFSMIILLYVNKQIRLNPIVHRSPVYYYVFLTLVTLTVYLNGSYSSQLYPTLFLIPILYTTVNFSRKGSMGIAIFSIVIIWLLLLQDPTYRKLEQVVSISVIILTTQVTIGFLVKEHISHRKELIKMRRNM
ncbi:hypothetical protein BHF71_08800 [Vulcanibacillus modesticaldus]|uniref:Uncharacterized protein n=1 Tax=Vulcanibacillus modesticaldus TaxID=337097 RepID=A0A1D2YUZ5_9BACI|nr:hypothetical protein [Vulcanibacillus modesticaldus]OEF99507.1 hypothetical protein BHF71_08800 [Vulcanibacillus modesticaldus]